MRSVIRHPKTAPPIWAYTPPLYARVIVVRTSIGTLLIGTSAQLVAMGLDPVAWEQLR